MKKRRKSFELKRTILKELKKGEMSLGKLERKVNTCSKTLLDHLEELKYFNKIEIISHQKNKFNGRPFRTARLRMT